MKKDHITPLQHVLPTQRQVLPGPLSKSSQQKILNDNNNSQTDLKKFPTASILSGGLQINQIKNVLEFIQRTMETLLTKEK